MAGRLDGHVSIVTGAAAGIGRAVAERFVAEGGCVVIVDRNGEAAEEVSEILGESARALSGDVTTLESNREAVALAVGEFGRLNSVVLNAGIWDGNVGLAMMDEDRIDTAFGRVFDLNVRAALLGAYASLSALQESGGSMLFTVSNSGLYPGGGGPIYVASKHAVVGLVRQLAHELAPAVRVNGICPGATMTEIRSAAARGDGWAEDLPSPKTILNALPLRRVSAPEDHASMYVMLVSGEESPSTTGALFEADGGWAARGLPLN